MLKSGLLFGGSMASILAWLRSKICDCKCQSSSQASVLPDNFEFALNYVFPNEGNYSNHPDDRGGPTHWGITQQTLSGWRKYPVTTEEVKDLTKLEASQIYHALYWTDIGLNLVKDKAIATCVFDSGILTGQRTAINLAQIAANNCGRKVVVDGFCGPQTVEALAQVDVAKYIQAYRNLLIERFDRIVTQDSTQLVFYKGWVNRANRLLSLVS